MKLLALAAKQIMGGGAETAIRPNQLPNAQGDSGESQLVALMKQQVELMKALITTNQQLRVAMVTPDYQVMAEGVAEPVEEINRTRNNILNDGRKGRTY